MTRVILVGAGSMGRAWLTAIAQSPSVQLAGIVDLDLAAARATGYDVPVGTDVVELARATGAEAVINVTVPAAHHSVTTAALFAGLPVLGEKPVADTVAQAMSLAAASEVTGKLFMVSQSRRWNPQLFRLKETVAQLGAIGTVTTSFFRAPHFGGFREVMPYPLLVDMAIHPFDSVRFLLDAEPVSVFCESYNPSWSWFAGDAAATAVFEMSTGARYVYTGSWCSPGPESSWNGSWRISGARGTAFWDGDNEPLPPETLLPETLLPDTLPPDTFSPSSAPPSSAPPGSGSPSSVPPNFTPPGGAQPDFGPPRSGSRGSAPPNAVSRPNPSPHTRSPHFASPHVFSSPDLSGLSGIEGALAVFVDALQTGVTPMGEVHENLMSLAMVEAAIASSRTHAPVRLADVLDRAYATALRDETDPQVRAALTAWPSANGRTPGVELEE